MQQFFGNYAIRIFLALAAIALVLLWIGYGKPVRAYLLTRGDEQIVVVGESHFHTSMEFDGYTDSIIFPALLASRRALFEGAAPESNEGFLRSVYSTPCSSANAPATVDGVTWNRDTTVYKPDTIDAVKTFLTVVQEKNPAWLESMVKTDPMWRQPEASKILATYDEAALWQLADNAYATIIENFNSRQTHPATGNDVGLSFNLWDYQETLNNKYNLEAKQSRVEATQDRWVSMCQATPEHRDQFVKDMFLYASKRMAYEASSNSYGYEPEVIDAAAGLLEKTLSCINADTLCTYKDIARTDALTDRGLTLQPTASTYFIAVSHRSKIIASRIIPEVHQHKRVFVIIGAAHLPDFMVDGQAQKSLLSMLADEGFSIKPIRYRWSMRGFMR